MKEDALEFLPMERWIELQEEFKTDWPRCISGYNLLENYRKWTQGGFDCDLKVYCPFGDARNGMVAITDGPCYEVAIICPSDTINVENALNRTQVVDWKRSAVVVPFAPQNIIDILKRVIDNKGLKTECLSYCDGFILNKSSSLFEDIRCPEGITLGLVTQEHAEFINSKWPYRFPGSVKCFQRLISARRGYGLFKDNNLISWLFVHGAGDFHHMYTLDGHRRQGYAELLLKTYSNRQMKEGKDVFGYVAKGNDKSFRLFKSIGFEMFGEVAWCVFRMNKGLSNL